MFYTLRLPTAGTRKYYVEGSQDVDMLSDIVIKKDPQLLMDIGDAIPALYHVRSFPSNAMLMLDIHGHQSELVFSDYVMAEEFAAWLTAVGEGPIGTENHKATTNGRAKPKESFYAERRVNELPNHRAGAR